MTALAPEDHIVQLKDKGYRGSAIVGPGRVDVFFGSGDYAAAAAAVTNRPGRVWVLLAK